MLKIVLMCSQGASTSILVQSMQKAARDRGVECSIAAYSVNEVDKVKGEADIILLGPQVKYMLSQVQAQVPCKVLAIDMRMYGMMDGAGVLETALRELEPEE